MHDIKVLDSLEGVAEYVADLFIQRANSAIQTDRNFSVAFAGGSTPRLLYTHLSQRKHDLIDWSHVLGFWGDERCVPPDHPASNFRMVRETLLDHVPIPYPNIYPMFDGGEPVIAAQRYEQILRAVFPASPANTFDLVLLGMGEDGHTASLFPKMQAVNEHAKWVVAYFVNSEIGWRITLTPAVINLARQVVVMVTGNTKAARLNEVLTGERDPHRLPIQAIMPASGHMLWAVDRAAVTM